MPKILMFTRFAMRDFIVAVGPALLAILLLCCVAYWLIDPTPPNKVTISTGQENSAYENFAKQYASALAKFHINTILQPSLGSQENLQRLIKSSNARQYDSNITGIGASIPTDIAFVQSGSTDEADAIKQGLVSLGSLFTEPVWLFYRDTLDISQLNQLKGLQINVGPEGSGVPQLFKKILSVNGVMPEDLKLTGLLNTPATVELLEGRIDGMVFSSAPDALLIQMLLQTPGIKLFDFTQAEAYTRRFPFLSHVVLPRGIVDLGRDLPSKDYHLIAPTATLVARASLHPALIDLFVQNAAAIHGGPGWFRKEGEFPTASYSEIPVARDAKKFYKDGPLFLQQYMPFWLANLFERMWVVVLAAGALLLPLSRIVPPLYVWKVRSRVYRWYGELRTVEQAIEDVALSRRPEVYTQQLQRLNAIEERVNQISIPLSFATELYGLRSHISFVRHRVIGLIQGPEQINEMKA
jgi:TRAP-type uncharacterized transport system substrate-binding protein